MWKKLSGVIKYRIVVDSEESSGIDYEVVSFTNPNSTFIVESEL